LIELFRKDVKRFIVDDKSTVSIVFVVNMVRMWGISSFKGRNIKAFLFSCADVIDRNLFHILVIRHNLILLYSQLIGVSIFVAGLSDSKLLDLSIFLLDVVVDDIATRGLQPRIGPLNKVNVCDVTVFCCFVHVVDKVRQLCVSELEFFKVGGKSLFEYFFTK
jgi:hypothetical protein